MTVRTVEGKSIDYEQNPTGLIIPVKDFVLSYQLEIDYEFCVGSDIAENFTYPFLNQNELFIGTGILPCPAHLEELAEALSCQLEIEGLSHNWQCFSNAFPEFHPIMLQGFFFYAAETLNTHHYQVKEIKFHLAIQKGKTIPLSIESLFDFISRYMAWLSEKIAPYQGAGAINILLLQAPANFSEMANHRSFATGENVYKGIVAYAPNDAAYLQKIFGHQDYSYFIFDGIAHEILHYYATSNWQGRYKAILYPAESCSPYEAHLLGETLTSYIHTLYLSEEKPEAMSQRIQHQLQHGQRSAFLDLRRFEKILGNHDLSVLALFRQIIQKKLQNPGGTELSQLFEILEHEFQLRLSPSEKAIFDEHVEANYLEL